MEDKANHNDFQAAIAVLFNHDESDRVVAIVGAAYLEDYLGRAIRTLLPGLTSELREKLFTYTGPLSTMSARIDFAKALNLITADVRSDLINISRIRNRFAHNLHVNAFDYPDVANFCMKLHLSREIAEGRGRYATGEPFPEYVTKKFDATPRGRFVTTTVMACTMLHNYLNRTRGSDEDTS